LNFKGDWSLKNRFPFRLGTTSYIIPADLLPNVGFLADKVDDIELVLFESDEFSNLPEAVTIERLKDIAGRFDLTYTIHLPLDTLMGHAKASVRQQSVDKCLRVIERTAPLSPFAYIVHFHGDQRGKSPSLEMERWVEGHRQSVERLLRVVDAQDLCVEMLDYPYELIDGIVTDYGLSVCLDMGHILLYGYAPEEYLDRYLSRTRVIHLHGVEVGQDHHGLAFVPAGVLNSIVDRLGNGSNKTRVVTMEIFDEGMLYQSMDVMSRYAS
jgi:sugar phosphate isomerase/epimerase